MTRCVQVLVEPLTGAMTMTKRKDAPDETETKSSTIHPPANPEATDQPGAAAVKQAAVASQAAGVERKASDDLHGIAQRLNDFQHENYSVPIANAIKHIGHALQALQDAANPEQQPAATPSAQEASSVVV